MVEHLLSRKKVGSSILPFRSPADLKSAGLAMALPFSIHSSKNMRTIALYILWAVLTLLLVKFSATILEEVLKVKMHHYVLNLAFILALVALHYFKFHKN